MKTYRLTTPLKQEDINMLRAGDKVLLTGILYTIRDKSNEKVVELIKKNKKTPFPLKNATLYYSGPTPTRPGQIIGACGPTTSQRMDPFTIPLLQEGVKLIIGKGERSEKVRQAMQKYKCIYAIAVGGAAALLAQSVKKMEVIAFPELDAQAIRRLEVEDFPIYVEYGLSQDES